VTLYQQGKISLMKVLAMVDLDMAKKIQVIAKKDYESLKDIKYTLEVSGEKRITYFQIKLTLAMMEK
jgi:uncharacterized protein YpbB